MAGRGCFFEFSRIFGQGNAEFLLGDRSLFLRLYRA